ncbi:MAG: hypothetical protein ACLFUF_07995 [Opitutales bacterium]
MASEEKKISVEPEPGAFPGNRTEEEAPVVPAEDEPDPAVVEQTGELHVHGFQVREEQSESGVREHQEKSSAPLMKNEEAAKRIDASALEALKTQFNGSVSNVRSVDAGDTFL